MQITPNSQNPTTTSNLSIEKKAVSITKETNVSIKINGDSPAAVVSLGESSPPATAYAKPEVKKGLDEEKIRELKAQMEESTKNVTAMFQKVLADSLGQGLQVTLANLSELDFSQGKIMYQGKEIVVDAETKAQAEAAISDTGFYGIENTAQRALEFAKALSGDNPEKAALLKDAVIKAYEQVNEMFGGKLPEITEKTHARTLELFDAWGKNDSEDTETVANNTSIEISISEKTSITASSLNISAETTNSTDLS